jgi:hypothetical protein
VRESPFGLVCPEDDAIRMDFFAGSNIQAIHLYCHNCHNVGLRSLLLHTDLAKESLVFERFHNTGIEKIVRVRFFRLGILT